MFQRRESMREILGRIDERTLAHSEMMSKHIGDDTIAHAEFRGDISSLKKTRTEYRTGFAVVAALLAWLGVDRITELFK